MIIREEGAKLNSTVVYSPKERDKEEAIITKELARFKKKYPSIEYHDYSRDSRFTDDDFFDDTHLNTDGAAHFTRILVNDFGL